MVSQSEPKGVLWTDRERYSRGGEPPKGRYPMPLAPKTDKAAGHEQRDTSNEASIHAYNQAESSCRD